MKKIAVFLMLAVTIGSCAAPQYAGTRMRDLADNVYKIEVSRTIDTSTLSELPFFKALRIEFPSSITLSHMGTAWVLKTDGKRSLIMTAGHVCEGGWEYHEDADPLVGSPELNLPVISHSHTLVTTSGKKITGLEVVWDVDDLEKGADLCMLIADGVLGSGMPIASHDPPYGSDVRYIGAPRGVWGGGNPLIYPGLFSGRGDLFDYGEALILNMSKGAPGASGSPVIYDGQVIGVFNLISLRHDTTGTAVPWDVIRKFIDEAVKHIPPMPKVKPPEN